MRFSEQESARSDVSWRAVIGHRLGTGSPERVTPESGLCSGRGGFRTCDLSRVNQKAPRRRESQNACKWRRRPTATGSLGAICAGPAPISADLGPRIGPRRRRLFGTRPTSGVSGRDAWPARSRRTRASLTHTTRAHCSISPHPMMSHWTADALGSTPKQAPATQTTDSRCSSGPGASPTVTRTLALRRERARGALVSAQGRAVAHDDKMRAVPAKQERAAVASRASLCSEPALRAITAGMPGRCRCEPIALRGLSELVPTQLSSGGPKAVALGRRSESLAAPHAE